jgi:hypothetical protein
MGVRVSRDTLILDCSLSIKGQILAVSEMKRGSAGSPAHSRRSPPAVMILASEHRRQAVCHLQAAGGRPGSFLRSLDLGNECGLGCSEKG